MKIVAVTQLVSRSMRGLAMALVEYGCNNNRLWVWEKVEWMV